MDAAKKGKKSKKRKPEPTGSEEKEIGVKKMRKGSKRVEGSTAGGKNEKKSKKGKKRQQPKEQVNASPAPSSPATTPSKKQKKKKKKIATEQHSPVEPATSPASTGGKKRKSKSGGVVGEKGADNTAGALKQKQTKKKKKKSKKDKGAQKTVAAPTGVSASAKEYRKANEITISPPEDESILPFTSFEHAAAHYPSELVNVCTAQFEAPTPVQAQCWPIAVANRDIIGVAETGSGKTLGFLMPAFSYILDKKGKKGKGHGRHPKVLVLAPTRELATQITGVAEEFGAPVGISSVTIYGGVPKGPQISALKRGVDIVIATPGRLLDLVHSGLCSLSEVGYLILDEADQMLDLGFEPDLRAIVKNLTTPNRQTLMFTATWPQSIRKLAQNFLTKPVRVNIGEESTLNANVRIKQIVTVVDPKAKDRLLEQLLSDIHGEQQSKIMLFCLYKKEAVRVGNNLLRRGYNCATIQGDLNQRDRSMCINNFKNGSVPLLVATDVAARGIDVPDVAYVINYTFPLTVEQYVHRIGRTGRAGKTGTAYTFFTQYDKSHTGELVNVLRDADQEIPENLLKFGVAVKRKEHPVYGAHYRDTSDVTKKSSHVKF